MMQRLLHSLEYVRLRKNQLFWDQNYRLASKAYQRILKHRPESIATRLAYVIAILKWAEQKFEDYHSNKNSSLTTQKKSRYANLFTQVNKGVLVILEEGIAITSANKQAMTDKQSNKNINDYLQIACQMIRNEKKQGAAYYDGVDFSNVKNVTAYLMLQVLLAKYIYFHGANQQESLDWLMAPLQRKVPEAISLRALIYRARESKKEKELLMAACLENEPQALGAKAKKRLATEEFTEKLGKEILQLLDTAIQGKHPFALSIKARVLCELRDLRGENLFRDLIAKENYYAYTEYARLLRDGKLVKKNYAKAIELVKKAYTLGACSLLFPLLVIVANDEPHRPKWRQLLQDNHVSGPSWYHESLSILDIAWFTEDALLKMIKEKYTPDNWYEWALTELEKSSRAWCHDNEKKLLSTLKECLLSFKKPLSTQKETAPKKYLSFYQVQQKRAEMVSQVPLRKKTH
jgi:hypothetical protein